MLAFTPLPSTPVPTSQPVYRLIMQTSPGRVDTGATYPGCAQNATQYCQPVQFATLTDAVNYAKAHNEIPVSVASADEAWRIASGAQPINPNQIISTGPSLTMLLLLGAAAFFIVPKFLRRS